MKKPGEMAAVNDSTARSHKTFMPKDRRQKRDLHALDSEGMVVCNPRDREAAHRAEVEGIATSERAAVTCRKCLSLLYERERERAGVRRNAEGRAVDGDTDAG